MTWYAAHVVMYVKLKNPEHQHEFPVWENVVLIQAKSDELAFAKAEAAARLNEGDDDGTFKWDGEPATWVFAGVRKLTRCEDPNQRPADLSEVTYIEMTAKSEKAIRDLVKGKQTTIKINDFGHEKQEVS